MARLAIAAVLAVAAVISSIIALTRTHQLSLPLPSVLPAVNIALPVLTAVVWPLSRRYSAQLKHRTIRALLPYLASASNLAPLALLILSLVFAIPSDIQRCASDRRWLTMFENKDESSIRTIQNRLQCCGLNSPNDRAWPFPSRGVDAGACQRTQGYHRACGNTWRHEETLAATLTAVSSLLNWLFLVFLNIDALPAQDASSRPAWHRPQHLIEGQAEEESYPSHHRANAVDSGQFRDTTVWDDNVPDSVA